MLDLAVLMLSFVAAGQTPPPPKPETPKPEAAKYKLEDLCTLEGIVRNAATGEPLNKVSIVARSMVPGVDTQPASTMTNAEGKFAMKDIEPGQYRLAADRPGFVRTEYGARQGAMMNGTTLKLEKAQSMKALEFNMTPHAVITGRIRDQDGDPVQYASVMLVRPRYMQGRKQMMPMGNAMTNDLGEYRLFGIAPGKYYLSVTMRANTGMFATDRSASAQPDEGYVPTYFPGTNDLASASQLNVAAAGTMQGVDVTLRRTRTYRIKGKVLGVKGNRSGMIFVTDKDAGAYMMERNYSNWRGPSGEFEVRGVRPGSYILVADHAESAESRLTGRVQVDVGDRDVTDVMVQLGPGIEVQGSLRTADNSVIPYEDITVAFTPKNPGMFGGGSARASENGTFRITPTSADEYMVRVINPPQGYYLKAARMGDNDILENGIDLSQVASASGIDLVLSPGAAKMTGSVADEKDNPVRGATVILRPTNAKPALLSLLLKTATTDQNGQFQMEGITPGEYQLLSFDAVDMMEAQDPELFKEHETKAVKLELKEKAQESRQLKVIPRKD